jgi:DNA-directed RNA polymerase specialized sigma subunit
VQDGSFLLTLADIEKQAIEVALGQARNRTEAAQMLGIGRSTLYRKIEEYGLCVEKERQKRLRKKLARIAAEREKHEQAGTLMIAA